MKQTISDIMVVAVTVITMMQTTTGMPTVRNVSDRIVDDPDGVITIVTDDVIMELSGQSSPINEIP